MIDMATYHTLHPPTADAPQDSASPGVDAIEHAVMQAEDHPGDDFLLTLPAKVPGFGFHNKRFGMSMSCVSSHDETNIVS